MGLWSVVRCGVVSVNGMEAQSRGTHVVDGSERGTTWKGEDGRTRGGGMPPLGLAGHCRHRGRPW